MFCACKDKNAVEPRLFEWTDLIVQDLVTRLSSANVTREQETKIGEQWGRRLPLEFQVTLILRSFQQSNHFPLQSRKISRACVFSMYAAVAADHEACG